MVSYLSSDISLSGYNPQNISNVSAFCKKTERGSLFTHNQDNNSFKKHITEWLLSCPLEEKFRLFMISDHHIVKIILKMYWGYILKGTNTIFAKIQISNNNSPQNEEIPTFSYDIEKKFYVRSQSESEFMRKRNKNLINAQKFIIKQLRIFDNVHLYDCLAFDEESLIDIKKILECFELISENQLFIQETSFQYKLDNKEFYFPFWFSPSSFQTIHTWIVSILEENIKKKFLTRKTEPIQKLSLDDDILYKNQLLLEFWQDQTRFVHIKIVKESLNDLKPLILLNKTSNVNQDLIILYQKNMEQIKKSYDLDGPSLDEKYERNLNTLPKEIFFKEIIYESIDQTCSLTSLCNKLIHSKINRKFLEFNKNSINSNSTISKKKKKKKKKKSETSKQEEYNNNCKECNNCEISSLCLKISHSLINLSIEKPKITQPENIIQIPNQNFFSKDPITSASKKEIKINEHIIEHHSETTCTRETRSVTESDFPNPIDEISILFEEIDRNKLSKKQKKKLKKKVKKRSDLLEKNIIEEKKEPINSPAPDLLPTPALSNLKPLDEPEKIDTIESIEEPKDKEILIESEKIIETKNEQNENKIELISSENKEKIEENPIKTENKPIPKENIDSDFIEVTKKPNKTVLVKDSKRFAEFNSKPMNPKQKTIYVRSNFPEETFKIEKDSRKKVLDYKHIKKSDSSKKNEPIKLINTIEFSESNLEKTEKINDKPQNEINEIIEKKENNIKKEHHGITLCKKKDAKDVLLEKIKRKEYEKQKGRKEIVRSNDLLYKDLIDPAIKKEYGMISQKIFLKKMENDLNNFTEQISQETLKMKTFRMLIFKRIDYIVQNLFAEYNAHVKMYGSCVTGLELPDSDLDIVISGFEKLPKIDTQAILSKLLQDLTYLKWVKFLKPIFTANIPLLKLELDPNIAFNEFTYPNPPINYIVGSENYSKLNLDSKIDTNIIIHVDISIENFNYDFASKMNFMQGENVGTLSTNFINHHLHLYSNLNKLIIVFKYFLYKAELNKSYQGGISSYCISLMIIAYLIENSYKFSPESPEILIDLFLFYGKKFNPKETGISLKAKPSPFFKILPNTEFGKLIIYEPITNNKNLALNTFLIDKILSEFSNAYDRINKFNDQLSEKIKHLSYNKLKNFEKLSFDDWKNSKEFHELMNIDIISDIICDINK